MIVAAIGIMVLRTFPTAAQCHATGGAVEPTGRYCIAAADGRTELREHLLGHLTDPVVATAIVAGVGVGLWWAARRDRAGRVS